MDVNFDQIYEDLYRMDDKGRAKLGVDSLPADLNEAIGTFMKDEIIKEAMGEHVTAKLTEAKKVEWNEYRRHVSEWEIKRYINRY